MQSAIDARLATLERSNRQLRALMLPTALAIPIFAAVAIAGFARPHEASLLAADSLRVRELVVLDSQGTVRVRLGAHLPDAVIDGRRMRRGADATGILLYDDGGRERSGYVTFSPSRSVALTLDTRESQVALFVADSADGVAARLWGGTNWVDMRADMNGARLGVGRSNELVVQQPPMTEAETAAECTELKEELRRVSLQPPLDRALSACKLHMPDAPCRKCLGVP